MYRLFDALKRADQAGFHVEVSDGPAPWVELRLIQRANYLSPPRLVTTIALSPAAQSFDELAAEIDRLLAQPRR